jgi:hypothetical protein
MWRPETEEPMQLNWVAILSFSGSVALSMAIWVGLFRAYQLLVN